MKPLRSWEAPKAALEEAVAKITPKKTEPALPRIARYYGLDPKKVRAKLRKAHGAAWKSCYRHNQTDPIGNS
jgi:hypothetical protein